MITMHYVALIVVVWYTNFQYSFAHFLSKKTSYVIVCASIVPLC